MTRVIPNAAPAQKIWNVLPGKKIKIQGLNGGVTCRFAARQEDLDNPLPFGGAQGFAFTSTDGAVEMHWNAPEIWAEGIAANASQPVIEFQP